MFMWMQLKSSLLLHLDGTSPIAEDIGRQVGRWSDLLYFPKCSGLGAPACIPIFIQECRILLGILLRLYLDFAPGIQRSTLGFYS